jgi:hypothetical protein
MRRHAVSSLSRYWWIVLSRAYEWTGEKFGGAPSPVVLLIAACLPPCLKWIALGRQATVQAVIGDVYTWGVGLGLATLLFAGGVVFAAPRIHAEQERRRDDLQRQHEQRVAELRQQIEAVRAKRLSIVFDESNGLHVDDSINGPVTRRLFRVEVRNDSDKTAEPVNKNETVGSRV